MPKTTPAKISFPLDIPEVDVLGMEETKDGKFVITVESRCETTRCSICGEEITCNYGHGQSIKLRHLSILGQETYIAIQPRRAKCPTCTNQPTTTQTLAWYERRSPHTEAYDRYLLKLLIGSTEADVSLKENLGYDAVLGALDRQVASQIDWSGIQHLGTQFVVVGENDVVMLKIIEAPVIGSFDALIQEAGAQAKIASLKQSDINAAIKKARDHS